MANKPEDPAQTPIEEATHRAIGEARRILASLQAAARLHALRPDGTVPVFYADEVFSIALPWSDIELVQMQMLGRRTATDDTLMQQILDLVPSLEGRTLLDVGSYTGATAMMLHRFLKPAHTHMFEPQNLMQEALTTTIATNPGTENVTLHQTVIDEDVQPVVRNATRPDRLAEAAYLRREGGPLMAQSIDSYGFDNVGMIHMDFNNTKINALNGAKETIEAQRPVVIMDLAGRDTDEIRAFFEPFDYEFQRAGRHAMMMFPN